MAKQSCLIAVVKISARRGTFPVRYLFPFSIYASVRNLLGHLVSNKKEIPYFNLLQGLWIFAYLFHHLRNSNSGRYSDKCVF